MKNHYYCISYNKRKLNLQDKIYNIKYEKEILILLFIFIIY